MPNAVFLRVLLSCSELRSLGACFSFDLFNAVLGVNAFASWRSIGSLNIFRSGELFCLFELCALFVLLRTALLRTDCNTE